jgi:hypothetical protein
MAWIAQHVISQRQHSQIFRYELKTSHKQARHLKHWVIPNRKSLIRSIKTLFRRSNWHIKINDKRRMEKSV